MIQTSNVQLNLRKTARCLLLAGLSTLWQPPVYAQLTWIGGVGGSWGVGANWSPTSQVPTDLEDVTINSGQAVVGAALVAESRALVVGDTAAGSLRIQSGGSLTSRDATLGNQAGSAGTATINAGTWNILGTPVIVGLAGSGTMRIESGGVVDSAGKVEVAQGAGSIGELTITGNSSELIAQAGVTVGDPSGGGVGTLNVRSNGKLTGGSFAIISINSPGVMNIESGGMVDVDFVFCETGSIVNNHGTISTSNDPNSSIVSNSGTLTGSGTQQYALLDSGVLAPDAVSPTDATGVYSITGFWNQQSEAELQIQLGGVSNGGGNKSLTTFDWVDVTGDVTLAGSLDVQLTGGFTPALGQSFEIINVGGTLTGAFAGLPEDSVAAVLGGMPLLVSYQGGDGNDVVLYVPTSFEADFDSDNDVDLDDLAQWEGDYAVNGLSDADGDGRSTGLDFLVWQRQYGYGVTPLSATSAAAPEPISLILIGSGLPLILRRTGRRSCVTY